VGAHWFAGLSAAATDSGQLFATVLWALAFIALAGTVIYYFADRALLAKETNEAAALPSAQ
jgi:hypothetical protein